MTAPKDPDEVGKVVLELADTVDIAAASEAAVTAQNRHEDGCPRAAQRLGERMHAAAVVGRAVDENHDLRAVALVSAIAQRDAVARRVSLHRGQVAEIDPGERIAHRRQRRWPYGRIER